MSQEETRNSRRRELYRQRMAAESPEGDKPGWLYEESQTELVGMLRLPKREKLGWLEEDREMELVEMPVERGQGLNQEELMRLLLIETTIYQLTERGLSQEETEHWDHCRTTRFRNFLL